MLDLIYDEIAQSDFLQDENNRLNAVVDMDGKLYRNRIEVLIMNDKNQVFLFLRPNWSMNMYNRTYDIPGGEIRFGYDKRKQAYHECEREVLIAVRNSRSYLRYREDFVQENLPYWYCQDPKIAGTCNTVFIAQFDAKLPATNNSYEDYEMSRYGKFYNLGKDLLLSKHHRIAINKYLSFKQNGGFNKNG